jgi:hypothetical protein
VARHLRLGEFLLGVEGIALMRHLFDADAQAAARLAEIRRIACGGEAVYQLDADVPIVDVASGPRAMMSSPPPFRSELLEPT